PGLKQRECSLLTINDPGRLRLSGTWDGNRQRSRLARAFLDLRAPHLLKIAGRRKREDDRVWEEHVLAVEVLDDGFDVALDLGALIPEQLTCIIASNSGDLCDLFEFVRVERKHEERVLGVLDDANRPTSNRLWSPSHDALSSIKSFRNRPCSQA